MLMRSTGLGKTELVADVIDLKAQGDHLILYVDTTEPEEPVDIPQVLVNLANLEAERGQIQGRLNGYLKELGL